MIKIKTVNRGGILKDLKKTSKVNIYTKLRIYGKRGVLALEKATPNDTGETASSWEYTIKETRQGIGLYWTNSNTENGTPVVIFLQYGHATRGGTYVEGIDFINPTLKPIFEELANSVWKEVNK